MAHDALGQLSAVIDPTGAVTTYTYDVVGQNTSVTDPDRVTQTTSYDQRGHAAAVNNATSGYQQTSYDVMKRPDNTSNSDGASHQSTEADMAPIYPEVALRLLACCREYRNGDNGLEILKAAVWSAAREITIPQERAVRDFLQQTEARLDVIQFTFDAEDVREAALVAVTTIEARLSSYLAGNDG